MQTMQVQQYRHGRGDSRQNVSQQRAPYVNASSLSGLSSVEDDGSPNGGDGSLQHLS